MHKLVATLAMGQISHTFQTVPSLHTAPQGWKALAFLPRVQLLHLLTTSTGVPKEHVISQAPLSVLHVLTPGAGSHSLLQDATVLPMSWMRRGL